MPNEAPVINEIKAPNIRIRPEIKKDQVGKWRKDYLTLHNYSSLDCLTGRTSLLHAVVVEVLQMYYLLGCAGG